MSRHGKQKTMTSAETSPTRKRYNGLQNQGATCYLNCVLQCLYMTKDFRQAVENFRPELQNSDEENIELILELQKLFKKLKEDNGTTEGITQSLSISNVSEQQDAVEYYQRTLKAVGPQVSKAFEVKISNKSKCLNNHIFQENCIFFTIPLPIEAGQCEVFNVVGGLEAFGEVVKLDEDNWLYCKHCGQKTETETWNYIEELPTILTLYPKRFYFDYNEMRPVKNHCPMDFPLQLRIRNTEYELYAVINHIGEETGGHYYAIIKSFEDDKWYCFDDSFVTEHSQISFQHSQLAYFLMYRKLEEPYTDEKSTNELQLHCQEYWKLVTERQQCIQYYISQFQESKFPTSYKETETLCHQFLEFMTQIPVNKAAKNRIEQIYKAIKGAMQIPLGYNLTDVEEWDQLLEVKTKQKMLLINEFQRVYCFHKDKGRVHLTHPELDQVMLCYIKDLLAWVEKNQNHILKSKCEADLPSIESHLGKHKSLHQSVSDFKSNVENAQADENQLSLEAKQEYRFYLDKLHSQYDTLLNSSMVQLHNLTRLQSFATAELTWLHERKGEEVKFDWSDNNTNMTAKKDNYSALITALHTQLCCCIETHLKENAAYFQFFADVKEAEEKMKKFQEAMKKKYICDRSTTVTHLEHLLQDARDENEQLTLFETHLDHLITRAKSIVQLKPRNPATPVKDSMLIQAVCDVKEITVHKGDSCLLLNNSHPFEWKVKSLSGPKATVPSIYFIIPPINEEAVESSSGLTSSWQKLKILWQKLFKDMKSLLAWQYLTKYIQHINSLNIDSIIMFTGQDNLLENLKENYHIFTSDSQNSEFFGSDECNQAEIAYNSAIQHYNDLLKSVEHGYQEESMCKSCINQIKHLMLRLVRYESDIVSYIRQLGDTESLNACVLGTPEPKKVQIEFKDIENDLHAVLKQSKEALDSSQQSTCGSRLCTERVIAMVKMEQVKNLFSVYWDKIKSFDLEKHSTQGIEEIRTHEGHPCDVHRVPASEKELESKQTQLKKVCYGTEPDKPVEAELRDAMVLNECMFGVNSEGKDDPYASFVADLKEGYQSMFAQLELRLQELQMQVQKKIQVKTISNKNKVLKGQLAQGKKLLEEIENNKYTVKESGNYATVCKNTVKDHKRQLETHKALVEPVSSMKIESGCDRIIQEIHTLQTRYCEVLTMGSQYIKINMDFQRYIEDTEKANEKPDDEERRKMDNMQPELDKQTELTESHEMANAKEVFVDEIEKPNQNIQQELQKHPRSYEQVFPQSQAEEENHIIQQKSVTETECQQVRDKAAEAGRMVAQEAAEKSRKPGKDETKKKRKAEKEPNQVSEEEQEAQEQTASMSKSMTTGRRSGHQYDTDGAIITGPIDQSALNQDCANSLLITGSADVLSGNMSGFRPHSSFGSTSSYTINPVPSIKTSAAWTEEMGPVAGILDTDTQEKLSVTEAIHRHLVDNITGQRLLEAQACTGGIIDPHTGEKFTVVDAINKGLVDQIMKDLSSEGLPRN